MTENEPDETPESIPRWLRVMPVDRVIRIDVGLEGNWSETVRQVWSQSTGLTGFEQVARSHFEYRPALELCLAEGWIGIPCFQVLSGQNVLDEAKARRLVEYVESRQGRTTKWAAIEAAVKQAAWQHLKSKDAAAALGCYEVDAIVASNGSLYGSFERFAEDTRAFYDTLARIELAVWDDMHVQILSSDAAVLTATVRWSSTDTAGVRMDLKGVWTAVYVRRDRQWKICARHESFEPEASRQ